MDIIPQELLNAKRQVDAQIDARNMLNALAQNYQRPQTSYVGLDPQLALASGQQTLNTLKGRQDQVNRLYSTAVQQDAQGFDDAMKASQIGIQLREHALNQAMKGLQMQHLRQQMAQASSLAPLKKMQNELAMRELQNKIALANELQGLNIETPVGKMSAAAAIAMKGVPQMRGGGQTKWAQDSEMFSNFYRSLGIDPTDPIVRINPYSLKSSFFKARDDLVKALIDENGGITPEQQPEIDKEAAIRTGINNANLLQWVRNGAQTSQPISQNPVQLQQEAIDRALLEGMSSILKNRGK